MHFDFNFSIHEEAFRCIWNKQLHLKVSSCNNDMLMSLYFGVISFVVTSDISFVYHQWAARWNTAKSQGYIKSLWGLGGKVEVWAPINFGLIQIYFGILFRGMHHGGFDKGPFSKTSL